MTDIEADRLARVALACLIEPGTRQIYELVATDGPVGALHRILRADPGSDLGAAVAARLRRAEPRQLAAGGRRRTGRLGAGGVPREEDGWRAQRDARGMTPRPGARAGGAGDISPPVCLWVRGELPLAATVERSV